MTYIYGPKECHHHPSQEGYLVPGYVAKPPLKPRTFRVGAISCHKPGEWLIRAWTPKIFSHESTANILIDWICYHIGRVNFEGLEWWGYTYEMPPSYMGYGYPYSGLTFQHFIPSDCSITKSKQFEGTRGWAYGEPEDLSIPTPGI